MVGRDARARRQSDDGSGGHTKSKPFENRRHSDKIMGSKKQSNVSELERRLMARHEVFASAISFSDTVKIMDALDQDVVFWNEQYIQCVSQASVLAFLVSPAMTRRSRRIRGFSDIVSIAPWVTSTVYEFRMGSKYHAFQEDIEWIMVEDKPMAKCIRHQIRTRRPMDQAVRAILTPLTLTHQVLRRST